VGRAYVAIAIDALIKAGNKPDEAKLFIQAKEYSPLSALATKKANSLSTAAWEWRSRFHQNRIKNDVAKKVFETGRQHLKKVSSSSDFTKIARMSLSQAKRIVLGPAFQRHSKLSSDYPLSLNPKIICQTCTQAWRFDQCQRVRQFK
jgi:hypothetical protein